MLSFFTVTTAGLYSFIRLNTLYFHYPIKVYGLKGRLLDHFTIAELRFSYQDSEIKIKNLNVHWQLHSLVHHHLPITQLSADSLELNTNGSSYQFKDIKLKGTLENKTITLNSLHFNYSDYSLISQLQINTTAPYPLKASLKLIPNTKKQPELSALFNIAGDINSLEWVGDVSGLGQFSVKGTLKNLVELDQSIKWRDLKYSISKDQILNSPEGRIKFWGTMPKLNIQFSTKVDRVDKETWQISSLIQGTFPWDWHFDINATRPQEASEKSEGLFTNLSLKGVLKDQDQGSIELNIKPGYYQMPKESSLSSLNFQGGKIKATLSPQALSGSGLVTIDDTKKINLSFKLPKFKLKQGVTNKQTVSSDLTLILNSLDFLQNLTPEIMNPKGILTASLKTSGTLKKIYVESSLSLTKASVELPNLGLNLNAIDVAIRGKKLGWEGNGSIRSGDKILHLKGKGLLMPDFTSDIAVEGSDFPLINTNEYKINIAPLLHIKYNNNLLNIIGTIVVPYAQIKLHSFSNSISLSNDVVFKTSDQAPTQNPINTQMDVQVQLGKQIELNAKGLHASLAGTVNIKQSPQGPINATGELNVIKGEYKAYAQNLSIEQGELFYTGGSLENPGINLRASKKINTSSTTVDGSNPIVDFNSSNIQNPNLPGTITVGVEVTGRLIEPEILLFSNPSILSQADILSMLVLGRPASQANKAGGQLLLAAISSMEFGAATKGTQMLEQVKQNLGLDFNVQTNSNYNLLTNTVNDKTALVVSKTLSKRISLSYNFGLSQADPNVVTLKYLLNRFFSIQVSTSSTSNGIDVLYTSSKK